METPQLPNLELDMSLEEKLDRIRLPMQQHQREVCDASQISDAYS